MKKLLVLLNMLGILFSLSAQELDPELFKDLRARSIGPAGMSGRVTAFDVVVNDPDIIFVGTATGGVWKSENGGISYTPIFEQEKAASIGAIALNQNNPNEIWVGTGEGNPRNSLSHGYGVFRSIDGGKSWEHMGLGETRNIHRVILHRDDPNTIWVGAIGNPWDDHKERGVFKSTDGGKTWRKVLYVNERTGVGDMVVDPQNPNKLIVGMWEHRRWPWYFKSGGEGSGMYVSYDGGENWTQRTPADGLPEGELGRMGLAIAPSNPNIVYALIEAKKTAFYRSEDGGHTFIKQSDKNVGGRPFYYADIFVDTKNENRIYNLYSRVSVSEDGGKTFRQFVNPNELHGDNHAWWSHPDDPSFLLLGNDGGMAVSRDKGKTWMFPETLPLGQFYHINYDMETPYHVYGGMQDNGTWRGPSQVWRRKGIRNLYWNRIGYGDGFDAIPDPQDARYGYSMLQGGSLLQYDLETGALRSLKPVLADGRKLRFNWNAAIALDPFEENTIYYGSQYLLKTTDRGASWEAISPDLTTNDPEKQQQLTTGGLSLDNSGAENFTTIITVEPSPLQQGLIWVGSDDGKLHVTRNGGKNWEDMTGELPGLPKGSWICQIVASPHNASEVYVVANNYRRGDWDPYVFHSKNYGNSFTNLVSPDKVWGYALSIAPDPVEEDLLFLGTEFGAYVSMDKGKNWQKWEAGLPTTSMMDMKIHPREGDWIIGTFGRSAFILDDIRPFREITASKKILDKKLHVFKAPEAYLAHMGEPNGYRSTGATVFAAENRMQGAMLSFYVGELDEKDSKALIEITDESGNLVRNFSRKIHKGFNRISWNLQNNGIRFPSAPKAKAGSDPPSGRQVVPGTYSVVVSVGDQSETINVVVKPDPKLTMSQDDFTEKAELLDRHLGNIAYVTAEVDHLRAAEKSLDQVSTKLKEVDNDAHEILYEEAQELKQKIKGILKVILPPKDIQGFSRDPNILEYGMLGVIRNLQSTLFRSTPAQVSAVDQAEAQMKPHMEAIKEFFEVDWKVFKKKVDDIELDWLGE
ncbi:MAG: hypothetical protein AAFR87_15930 [Bacteroidota bacterium]